MTAENGKDRRLKLLHKTDAERDESYIVPREDRRHWIPHLIYLREQGSAKRQRYIRLRTNPDLTTGDMFILLFCAAQSEIQKFRAQGITLKTERVVRQDGPRGTDLKFPMESMPESVLDEYDLQEIPRNTYWPTPELR